MDKKLKLEKSCIEIERHEQENINNKYNSGVIYKNLGISRETLRYYEKLGIIQPEKGIDNHYREFGIDDINVLLAIDFYKKRGFLPLN